MVQQSSGRRLIVVIEDIVVLFENSLELGRRQWPGFRRRFQAPQTVCQEKRQEYTGQKGEDKECFFGEYHNVW